jgi:hypothetical protein
MVLLGHLLRERGVFRADPTEAEFRIGGSTGDGRRG